MFRNKTKFLLNAIRSNYVLMGTPNLLLYPQSRDAITSKNPVVHSDIGIVQGRCTLAVHNHQNVNTCVICWQYQAVQYKQPCESYIRYKGKNERFKKDVIKTKTVQHFLCISIKTNKFKVHRFYSFIIKKKHLFSLSLFTNIWSFCCC